MNMPRTRIRYVILSLLFVITTINYADRAILSIVGSSMQKELGISPVQMGILFSAFAWAYVIGQIPGGWLIDRFGTKHVYAWSIFLWSLFTMLQSAVGWLSVSAAVITLFLLRFLVGLAESPSFPGNSRLATAWFPSSERGTAAGIFTSAQYFAAVLFSPLMGWVVYQFGWHYVFVLMGGLGMIMTVIWLKSVYSPAQHPKINRAELQYIEEGGGIIDMDSTGYASKRTKPDWSAFRQLLRNRMMLGIFIAQYCINTLSYFFLTWFPVYLVQERGMSILKAGFIASVPAICGFLGGVLSGMVSDALIRSGKSLTFARKAPLVIGMLMSTSMVACNYVNSEWLIVFIMAFAYFGKGFGAIGWAVVSDTAPKSIAGICGGLFNACGNTAGITTPIIIGIILQMTGSFEMALIFVAANAAVAIFCYLFVVGKIQRMEITKSERTQVVVGSHLG